MKIFSLLLIPASIVFAAERNGKEFDSREFGKEAAEFLKNGKEKNGTPEGAIVEAVGNIEGRGWVKEGVGIVSGLEFGQGETPLWDYEDIKEAKTKRTQLEDSPSDEFSFGDIIEYFIENNNREIESSEKEEEIFLSGDPLLLDCNWETDRQLKVGVTTPAPAPEDLAKSAAIDYMTGATQSANGDLMKRALEKIASGGAAQEYIISMERISPLATSAMKQIQTWANQLNAMSVMSNELVSLISPGLLHKKERADSYLCEHAMVANEWGKLDLVGARRYAAIMRDRPELQKKFTHKIDVADKILASLKDKENQLRLIKQITGTVKVGDTGQIEMVAPQYRQAIQSLQKGEMESLWDEKTILAKMEEIQRKLKKNLEFEGADKEFLCESEIPIGNLITLLTQYKGGGADAAIGRYAALISYAKALQFSEEAARKALDAAKSMMAVQITGYELQAYIAQVEEVLKGLSELKTEHHRKGVEERQALETMILIDRSLKEKEKGL